MPYQTKRRSFSRSNTRRPSGQSFAPRRNNNRSRKSGPKKDYIHPSRFVRIAKPVERDAYVPTHQFADFRVADLLKSNLAAKGYITPSPIQDQAIPQALSGKDVVGIANTGTGKTAAFAIPTLHKLMNDSTSRALIIAPTRELAQQIDQEFGAIGRNSRLSSAVLIGGSAMGPQLRDLRSNPRVVIGTPGRIKDHMERGTLKLCDVNTVVLDEVDRMLDMGFVHDVTTILSQVSPERQSLFFSATLDHRVAKIITTFSNDPATISVKQGETSDNVHQDIVAYETKEDKIIQLHNILCESDVAKTIIFDDTQRSVERLSKELASRGFKADAIHGGKTQGQRQRALKRLKTNEISVLVATDVAARGIDIADISHVINFSTPQTYDDYIHRIGRAGRAGKVGYALTFVSG